MRAKVLPIIGAVVGLLPATASAESAEGKTDMKRPSEVFFAFDSSELSPQARIKLDETAEAAKNAPDMKLVIDGHCDPRGTSPYNVGLSIRRNEAVRDRLIANGIDRDRIIMAAYGEDGPRRATFSEDRRVSVELTDRPLYSIIDHAMPNDRTTGATAVTWSRPASVAEIDGPRAALQTARR